MRKTLVVTYLPRGERSKTKRLLDSFLSCVKTSSVETLDLCKCAPDFFTPESLSVYYERNFDGQKIEPKRESLMKKMDEMAAQFKNTDILVMASPMHNFSFPAPIKAYFDSVMQKGVTWTINETGYQGFMNGKKALYLFTSGGTYEGENASMDHLSGLAKAEFHLMGFGEIEIVSANGINLHPGRADEIVSIASEKAAEIARRWYI